MNKAEYVIARAGREHIPGIYDIECKSFAVPWSMASIEKEFMDNPARYFVALAGTVVGYCGYWSVAGEGHITNVAVHPDFRRQGIGAALVLAMLSDMKTTAHSKATLEVREDNYAAISLYENFGFTSTGIRKNYYAHEMKNALIMWCIFDSICGNL